MVALFVHPSLLNGSNYEFSENPKPLNLRKNRDLVQFRRSGGESLGSCRLLPALGRGDPSASPGDSGFRPVNNQDGDSRQ